MQRTVITITTLLVLFSSFVFATDKEKKEDLPAYKQAQMEPVGHDIVPGYVEKQPVNDVFRSASPREQQSAAKAPINRVQRNTNYGDPRKDYTKDELERLLQRAKTNKRSLSQEELSAVEEYMRDIERQKARNFINNSILGRLYFSSYSFN